MSVPFFYEPLVASGIQQYTMSEASSKHCIQVLRMQEGDRIDLTNGQGGLFHAIIQVAHKKNAIVQITDAEQHPVPNQQLHLGISLLKNAVRLEWLFEKATEMGVTAITPLICDRTIHERFKTERMEQILQSAMIQSQQTWLPKLAAPTTYHQCIDQANAAQKLIAHCAPSKKTSIKAVNASNDILLLIGPEGDFSPAEIEVACNKQYEPIELGPTRLRTETAGIFAISVLKNF